MMDEEQFGKLILSLGERRVQQKQSTFERHAQTVLVGIITLAIAGVSVSLTTMKDQQNELITGQEISTLKIEQLTTTLLNQQKAYVSHIEYITFKQQTENRLETLEK